MLKITAQALLGCVHMTEINAIQILKVLDQTGRLVLRGASSLVLLRDAIRLAVRHAGVTVQFDPASERRLVDYLTLAGFTAAERATTGAIVGLLLGSLFGRPTAGMLIGTALGASSGASAGIALVRKGWRINARREADGTPLLQVVAA
jgi:hypothetical protein